MKTNLIAILLLLGVLRGLSQTTFYEKWGVEKPDCYVGIPFVDTLPPLVIQEVPEPDIEREQNIEKSKKPKKVFDVRQLKKSFKKTSRFYKKELHPQQDIILEFKNSDVGFLKNGHYGVKNKNGKVMVKPIFDIMIPDTILGGFVGYQGENCNYYLGKQYKKILPDKYYSIQVFPNKKLKVRTNNGFGVITLNKEVIIPIENKGVSCHGNDGNYIYNVYQSKKNSYLYIEKEKKKVYRRLNLNLFHDFQLLRYQDDYLAYADYLINTKTLQQFPCTENFSIKILDAKRKIMFVSRNTKGTNSQDTGGYLAYFSGELISDSLFHQIAPYGVDGLANASIKKNKRIYTGLINQAGEFIIAPKYKTININYRWIKVIDHEGQQGIFDLKGNEVFPPSTDPITIINHEYFTIKKNTKLVDIIKINTKEVIEKNLAYAKIWPDIKCKSKKYYIAQLNNLYSFRKRRLHILNEKFELASPNIYRMISILDNKIELELYEAANEDKKQYCDCNLKPYSWKWQDKNIEQFNQVIEIEENFTYINVHNKHYFLLPNNNIIEADTNWHFKNNIHIYPARYKDFYILQVGHQKGLINKAAEIIIPPIFTNLQAFDAKKELMPFSTKEQTGFFDKNGKVLFQSKYPKVAHLIANLFLVTKNGKKGVINRQGKEIIPTIYDYIYWDMGLIRCTKTRKEVRYFTLDGHEVRYDIEN